MKIFKNNELKDLIRNFDFYTSVENINKLSQQIHF